MAGILEQLQAAQREVSRLTGETSQLSTLREQLAQVPNGDLAALLSEHASRGDEVTRLTGELDVATTRATTAETDLAALRAERVDAHAKVEEQAETLAANIVASTGTVPAAAESAAVVNAAEPANFEAFRAEYSRLQGESPAKGSAYYKAWSKKFKL